jgi:Protein of unknown function (DUF3631)
MLRGQSARWAADNMESLRRAKPTVPEGFYNRVACNWRPLLAVADRAGGNWPELARKAAEALTGKDPGTVYAETLAAIKTLFGDKERMFSEDLVRELHAIEGGPWAEWGKSGKPISQNALARLLKPIAPENVRIGIEQKKGYERAKFQDAFDRYLDPEAPFPPSQPSHRPKYDEIRTSEAFATVPAKNGGTDGKCEKPNNDGLWDGWTDGKGGGIKGEGVKEVKEPFPEALRRCDHCGQPATAANPLNGWDWPGRPDGIRLHRACEADWFDCHKPAPAERTNGTQHQAAEPAKKPWSTPTVEEVPWDTPPIELRKLALGLPDQAEAPPAQPDQPVNAPDGSVYDEVMRAIEMFCPDRNRRQEAVKDATTYLARWGGHAQGCGWTPVQQAALIWQMHGREVTALGPNQASIGNKVIYRLQT